MTDMPPPGPAQSPAAASGAATRGEGVPAPERRRPRWLDPVFLRCATLCFIAALAAIVGERWITLRHSVEVERLQIERARSEAEVARAGSVLEMERARLEYEQVSVVLGQLATISASSLPPEEKKQALRLSLNFYADLGVLSKQAAKSVNETLSGAGKLLDGGGKFLEGAGKGISSVAQAFRSTTLAGQPVSGVPCCSAIRDATCCSSAGPRQPVSASSPPRKPQQVSAPCDQALVPGTPAAGTPQPERNK